MAGKDYPRDSGHGLRARRRKARGWDMLGWVVGGVGTFAVSLVVACMFLQMRCHGGGPPLGGPLFSPAFSLQRGARGVVPPFGRHARPWAIFIVLITALVSTGFGLLILAASHQAPGALAGGVRAGGLWVAAGD